MDRRHRQINSQVGPECLPLTSCIAGQVGLAGRCLCPIWPHVAATVPTTGTDHAGA
jgi:hypothetical protein